MEGDVVEVWTCRRCEGDGLVLDDRIYELVECSWCHGIGIEFIDEWSEVNGGT